MTSLLARVRDVEPGEPEAAGGNEKLRERLDGEPESLQIDQLVDVAEPLGRAFALMETGRPGRLNAGADQAGENGAALIRSLFGRARSLGCRLQAIHRVQGHAA